MLKLVHKCLYVNIFDWVRLNL